MDQGSLFRKYPQIEGLECVCHAMLQQSNMGQRQGKCDVCMARGRLMLLQELDGKRGGKDSVTDSLRRLKDENETIGRGATVSGGSMTRGVPIPISSSSLQSAKGRSGLSGRSSQTPPSSSSSHSRASTLSPGPYHSPNSHSSFIVRGAMASSTSLPNPPTHGHEDEFHHHENSEEDEHHTKVENVGPAECPCSRAEGSKTLLDITLPVSLEKFAQHMVLTTKPRNGWYIEFFRDVVKISGMSLSLPF